MKHSIDDQKPVWLFLGKLLDAAVLHVLWLLCCLPVVTFGASTSALYDVMMKSAANEDGHYYRMFFRSFKSNLRKGIVLGLIFLVLEGMLLWSFFLCTWNAELNPSLLYFRIPAVVLMVLFFMMFEYVFPLQARFENTVPMTLRNGFLLSVRNLGWTIVMTLIPAAFYALVIWLEKYLLPLMVWGFGLIAFLQAFILNRIFRPFIEAGTDEEA